MIKCSYIMEIVSVLPNIVPYICNDLPITSNTCEVFLGLLYGNIIGYIIIGNNKDGYSIEHFHVIDKYRDKGLGTRLLRHFLENYNHASLMVAKNNLRAIHIYQKHDFKVACSKSTYYVMVR